MCAATETEFVSLIDCRFPYHDRAESQRLLVLGCSISSNAAFMVVEELARVPASVTVAPDRLLDLLEEVNTRLEHPIKELVIDVAKRFINGDRLSLSEARDAMREVAVFRNQFCALNVIYFAADEPWEEVDSLYDEITGRWREMA